MDKHKQNKNIIAISVGFFLIAAVALITFLDRGQKSGEKNIEKSDVSENSNPAAGINRDILLKKISFGEPVNIIDIRNAESFAKEHILGAFNYSLEEMQKNIEKFDKSASYVIIDDFGSSPTVLILINYLSQNGFENIAYLENGFAGWKENFNPTISLGNPYSFSDQSKVTYIKNEELKSAIESGEAIFIIDIRGSSEFAAMPIQGAVNIPFSELESRRNDIPRGKKIIIGGADAVSSFQGAVILFDMGFSNVFAMNEGFK